MILNQPALQNQCDKTLRNRLITELYSTGRLDGMYFGIKSRSKKNPIREYIRACLYKNHLNPDGGLLDDCYNEAFVHLCAMSDQKVCELYRTSPSKLTAWVLRIIVLKCFAKDNRTKSHRHSLLSSVMYASTWIDANAVNISHTDEKQDDDHTLGTAELLNGEDQNVTTIISDYDDLSEFAACYGYEVEDLIDRLDDQDLDTLYKEIGKQRCGQVPKADKERRLIMRSNIINQHLQLKSA